MNFDQFKECPVQIALNIIGKKWGINLIRDMLTGKKKFAEFLSSNTGLSTRMLALRLKELEQSGIITKLTLSDKPLIIEYHLSEIGFSLNKLVYELSVFSLTHYQKDIFSTPPANIEPAMREAKRRFKVEIGN